MGTWASIQPKKVSSTLQEGGTPVILLARVHADVLLWMPAMPDLGTSLRLGNISSTFKGMPDAPSLPFVVGFGCLAPPRAMPDRRSEFPIGRARPKILLPGPSFRYLFGIPLDCHFMPSFDVCRCAQREKACIRAHAGGRFDSALARARPPPPPAPCCLYQICI